MKLCKFCNTLKNIDEFSNDKQEKDGKFHKCKKCVNEYYKLYRQKNKEKINTKKKVYYNKFKEKIKHKRTKYNMEEYRKKYRQRPGFKEKYNSYRKNKKQKDINFKLCENLRSRFKQAFKESSTKNSSVIRYLGCSIEQLKRHLESQFYPNPDTGDNMTWENYGFYGWHIDHIKPLSSFDLTQEDEIKRAWDLSNLQPLWMKQNLIKNKYFFSS
jgi:hypothetical protein